MSQQKTNKVHAIKIFDAVTTDSAEMAQSENIIISDMQLEGFFALDIQISGDGTAEIWYEVDTAYDDSFSFIRPQSVTETYEQTSLIASGLTKTSGPDGDGHVYISFQPVVCRKMRIIVHETSMSSSGYEPVTVTGYLVAQ